MMYGSCYLHLQAALPREERALLAAQIRRGDRATLVFDADKVAVFDAKTGVNLSR